MKLVDQLRGLLGHQDEILAIPSRSIGMIKVNRQEGKFLPDGRRSILIRFESQDQNVSLMLDPEEFQKFIKSLQAKGAKSFRGVLR